MKEKFIRRKLKNGMSVLFEKRDLPVVSLSITNPFGAAFESSDIKGVAHFIEHLVFTGTKTRTHEDISREIEKKGGILNAFTSHEVTSFWFKMPSEHVFAGIDILADMLNNAVMKNDKFEKEKGVIMQEIRMYHDAPARYIFDMIEGCLYEKPFGETVIGSEKTIKALDRDFVYNYFRKNYSSGNLFVTIVGNVDIEKVCECLEEKFSGEKNEIKGEKKIVKKNGRIKEEREGVDQAQFVLAMHAPLMNDTKMQVLEVLDAYLANGMSSKLFLKIREQKGLAYTVRGEVAAEKNYSHYMIYAGTKKEALEEVEKDVVQGFKDMDKMNEKDLKEAKERLIGLRRIAREESDNVMNQLMFAELVGKAEDYYKWEDKVKKVKLEDVKKLAKELIKEYSVAAIVPK